MTPKRTISGLFCKFQKHMHMPKLHNHTSLCPFPLLFPFLALLSCLGKREEFKAIWPNCIQLFLFLSFSGGCGCVRVEGLEVCVGVLHFSRGRLWAYTFKCLLDGRCAGKRRVVPCRWEGRPQTKKVAGSGAAYATKYTVSDPNE